MLDFPSQIEQFKKLLDSGIENSPQALEGVIEWLRTLPGDVLNDVQRDELLQSVCSSFTMTRERLEDFLKDGYRLPTKSITSFDTLIPTDGFLRLYYEYTLKSEPPSVFHFFCGLTAFGASLQRRVKFNRGLYDLYPYFATVLIAPTGKCRKTSAANVGIKLLREVGDILVLSDRLTPEYLCHALKVDGPNESACAILSAPEFADFIGKQRYLEGLVPLLTSLFDCPDSHSTGTIMRKEEKLYNVALCMLACSTEDWLTEAMPHSIFGGGFMSRLLLIVQHDTDRVFPTPPPPNKELWAELVDFLKALNRVEGNMTWSKPALDFFNDWYLKHKRTPIANERFAGYHQRKPDHLIRIAMCLQLAEWRGLILQLDYIILALKILDWTEQFLPEMFERVTATQAGTDHQRIIKLLRNGGGRMRHSDLLRKNQYYMNARTFRECMLTLKESQTVKEIHNAAEHVYILI